MYALFLFWWPFVFEDSLKYQLFSSVAKKYSIRGTREALFTSSYTHPLSNIHRSERSL